MENENVKLTPEQLEYYRKTNPKYFSQIISYYSVNDPTYYRSVVEPFLINLQKANKKKNRNIVIIVSLILVIILIIGYIRSQDPEFQKKMEVEKKEKELKAQQDVQNKKDEEQKKIAAEKEKKDQQAANENQKKQESDNNQNQAKQEENKQPKINDEVTVGNFAYKVFDVEFKKTIGNNYFKKTADGIYLLINLGILNTSKESRTLDNSMFKLVDDGGIEFETSSDATSTLELSGYKSMFLKKCQPNIPTNGVLIFEVPNNKLIYNLKVSGGFWTGKTGSIRLIK